MGLIFGAPCFTTPSFSVDHTRTNNFIGINIDNGSERNRNRFKEITMNDSGFTKKRILLLKVGGSSITQKGKLETLDVEALEWFSGTIRSTIHEEFVSAEDGETSENDDKPAMIIVHGAGSFGHHTAKQYGLGGKNVPPPDGMALTKDLLTGIAKTRLR